MDPLHAPAYGFPESASHQTQNPSGPSDGSNAPVLLKTTCSELFGWADAVDAKTATTTDRTVSTAINRRPDAISCTTPHLLSPHAGMHPQLQHPRKTGVAKTLLPSRPPRGLAFHIATLNI